MRESATQAQHPPLVGLGDQQRVTAQVAGEQTEALGQGASVRGG